MEEHPRPMSKGVLRKKAKRSSRPSLRSFWNNCKFQIHFSGLVKIPVTGVTLNAVNPSLMEKGPKGDRAPSFLSLAELAVDVF